MCHLMYDDGCKYFLRWNTRLLTIKYVCEPSIEMLTTLKTTFFVYFEILFHTTSTYLVWSEHSHILLNKHPSCCFLLQFRAMLLRSYLRPPNYGTERIFKTRFSRCRHNAVIGTDWNLVFVIIHCSSNVGGYPSLAYLFSCEYSGQDCPL